MENWAQTGKMYQNWCARFQYPGKKQIMFGHITAPKFLTHEEASSRMKDWALEYIPEGFEILEIFPGTTFFRPD